MACRAGALGCASERCLRRVRHEPRVSSMPSASSRTSGAPHDRPAELFMQKEWANEWSGLASGGVASRTSSRALGSRPV